MESGDSSAIPQRGGGSGERFNWFSGVVCCSLMEAACFLKKLLEVCPPGNTPDVSRGLGSLELFQDLSGKAGPGVHKVF